MHKIGIVAAMEREVRPLIRRWRVAEKEYSGHRFRFYEHEEVVLVCGGIGPEPARRAAEALIALYSPNIIYSVGFAGALHAKWKVGDVISPRTVIHANDASRVELTAGEGVLVSFASVADPAQKARLRESFSADAVDMEAAAVARAAQTREIEFNTLKVISDEFDFQFPSTERFIDAQGQFSEWKFAGFAAIRPWLWPSVFRLARNSARAAQVLSQWLADNIGRMTAGARLPAPAAEALHRS